MSGVYNRKLFRQSNSRNAFHGMGGILSSSNELMQQAMQTANNAPMPADLGPVQLKPQSAMPQPQAPQPEAIPYDPSQAGMLPPDQGAPAEPAPPDPMGQMQGQAPMDPMQQQPMGAPPEQAPPQEASPMPDAPFMPPGTPPSVAGYQDGGTVLGRLGGPQAQQPSQGGGNFLSGFLDRFKTTPEQLALEKKRFAAVDPVDMALLQAGGAGGFFPNLSSDPVITAAADAPSSGPVDIGVTAGTVETPQLTADAMAGIAEQILPALETDTPEEVGQKILVEAEKNGVPTTGNPMADLMGIYSELTGDPEATNKTIDDLNRGILGAAIAAGKSPRATENIANGMLVGLQAMKDTETARAAQAAQAQYGLMMAALTPKTGSKSGDGLSPADPPADRYYELLKLYTAPDAVLPEGVDETNLQQYIEGQIRRGFTDQQLAGTSFAYLIGAPAAGAPPPATGAPTARSPEEEQRILDLARKNIPSKGIEAVRKTLESMGIDPEKL